MTHRIELWSRATNPGLEKDLLEWAMDPRTFAPGPMGFRDALREVVKTRESIEQACGNLSYPAIRLVCGDTTIEGEELMLALSDLDGIELEIEDARKNGETPRPRLQHYREIRNHYLGEPING